MEEQTEYVSSLWYFDEIDFLRDQETQIQGTSTIDKTEFIKGNYKMDVQFFFFHEYKYKFIYDCTAIVRIRYVQRTTTQNDMMFAQ